MRHSPGHMGIKGDGVHSPHSDLFFGAEWLCLSHELIPFTSAKKEAVEAGVDGAFSGLSHLYTQISAESSPGYFIESAVSSKRASTDRESLFKDAFPPGCFWMWSISVVLGWPQSLPRVRVIPMLRKRSWMVHVLIVRTGPWQCCSRDSFLVREGVTSATPLSWSSWNVQGCDGKC